jgi:molybdopterin adenylyltransferase
LNTIKAISISDRKGIRKNNIAASNLIADFGLEKDAHGGTWHRQVSFLAQESINTMRAKGLDVVAGNFAENITTEGFDLTALQVGRHMHIGDAELVISQLGKICHTRCAIYHQAGDCVMPREGIFAVILQGGTIRVGDQIKVSRKISRSAAIIGTKETKETQGPLLQKVARETFKPAFIRFDTLSQKEGGALTAILDDLVMTQKTNDILIFDPSGNLGLDLVGYKAKNDCANCYQREGSTIFYCRSVADLQRL